MMNRVYRLTGSDDASAFLILCDRCAARRGDAIERCQSCGEQAGGRCESCGYLADLRGRRVPHVDAIGVHDEGTHGVTPYPAA